MVNKGLKCKTVKHYHEMGELHELTFCCYRRLPLLADEVRCLWLAQAIDAALTVGVGKLLAFVFMPNHVHLLVDPATPRIDQMLFAIKRPFSARVKARLAVDHPALLRRLTVRERPGKSAFRFWQEGPGYDRNLIRDESVLRAIEYIHNNPVRRGMCSSPAEWPWSSWKHYHRPDDVVGTLPKVVRFGG